MSKDIRSYFTKTPDSKAKSTKNSSPGTRKRIRRVIESDDENDDIIFVKKKSPSKPKTQEKKPEITVKVEDFFGNTPILQKKHPVPPTKKKGPTPKEKSPKKQKKSKKKDDTTKKIETIDLEFENDDELEASLLQTDDEQLMMNTLSPSKSKPKKSKDKHNDKKESRVESEKKIEKTSPKKEVKKTSSKKEENAESPKKEEKTTSSKKETNKTLVKKFERTPVKDTKRTPQKEPKIDESLASSEKKKKNAEAYQKYLNRGGPKNPGSKEIPKGTPTCLQGLSFVITGVLDSLEREEATEMIQKCGGRVVSQVSKKTDFVVVGEEPGVSKMQKAEKFGTKKINEDELLNLIRDKSNGEEKKTDFINGTPEKTSKYFDEKKSKKRRMEDGEDFDVKAKKAKKEIEEKKRDEPKASPKKTKVSAPSTTTAEDSEYFTVKVSDSNLAKSTETTGEMLWVDKYKPKSTKNIVGQAGEKSNVKKLTKWLQNWHKNHLNRGTKKAARPPPWMAQNDDGSYFKAALLSGPPGVGKTTSVHLVCQELGLNVVEFNASDTRSKRLLQDDVSKLLSTKSIRGYLQGNKESYTNHVLVMDEVDGMAGNEDRGGIQELIQFIKNTKVPIVGICNDRNHPKMRSLVNYCFDLRFQRPRVEQIKGAMKSICFKENIDISGEALEELIISSNHDIRQILHNLSLLASGNRNLSLEDAKKKAQQGKKPLNLGPWDVVRKVFSATEQEKMSFTDKTDLFFQDYSLGPLFVQDSYIRVKPYKAKGCEKKKLELISKAADSIALGDIVDKKIRSQNSWGLLPVQAIFSSVLPGHYMSGHIQGQVQFPAWLGKFSRSNKFDRLQQDLHSSLRISITGTKESTNLDYLQHLKDAIVRPLVEQGADGVQESLKFMLNYQLTREDLDHILELTAWPGVKDSFSEVDPKVKAALTRALNKESQLVSHSAKKLVKTKGDEYDPEGLENEEGGVEEDEGGGEEEEESDNIDFDPMIKKGKPKKVNKEESCKKNNKTEKGTKGRSSSKAKEKGKK